MIVDKHYVDELNQIHTIDSFNELMKKFML